MLYKSRKKSNELIVLELLHNRMNLTSEDKQHYHNLKKGYEGELMFDALTEKLQCECLILNDLLLKVKKTSFQVDSLIITQEKLYLYEIKTLDGDYYYESDRFYKNPRFEVANPLIQLSKTDTLFRQLLLSQGYKLPVESRVVFMDPTFFLYQAPLDKPFIFPTQVKKHLKNVNAINSKVTDKHKKLSKQLVTMHNNHSPFTNLPSYNYDQLQKGITCLKCHSFSIFVENSKCTCKDCGHTELVGSAVLRTVKEFQKLFPKEKITTSIIHDWCRLVHPKTILRILKGNYKKIGQHRWIYFE